MLYMENFYYDVYDWFNTDTAIVTIYWYGYNYYILIQLEWLYNDMVRVAIYWYSYSDYLLICLDWLCIDMA